LKAARQAFSRGLKLEKSQDLDQAFYEFEAAAQLVPQNVEYLTAREVTRQHLAGIHLESGNRELLAGRQVEAMAEFRAALSLDPQNEFALQRVSDALGLVPVHTTAAPQLVASTDSVSAKPIDGRHDFHYRGDSRGLISAIATSYGLTVMFDDSFPSRRVRFEIEDADFTTAIQSASAVTKSFSFALEDTVLYVCADTPDNHRLFDRMGLRSFYIPGGNPAQELNELMNSLRTLFEFKFVGAPSAAPRQSRYRYYQSPRDARVKLGRSRQRSVCACHRWLVTVRPVSQQLVGRPSALSGIARQSLCIFQFTNSKRFFTDS